MGYICDSNDGRKRLVQLIKDFRKEFYSDFSVTFDSHPFCVSITIREGNKDIAGFTLIEQHNCCGILVSTKTFVKESHQKRGLAQEMMPMKEVIAKEYGYSCLMATVNITGNAAEKHILEKFGWTMLSSFKNSRTKNTVGIFTKNL